ncbi:hypothetical protein JCM11641_003230 [Rhodosporidiobolus odoratus]
MPPAPRPISSRRPAQAPISRQEEAIPSSLDLLFSVSRSAGFYGENVASVHNRPSFVERYKRPEQYNGEGGRTTDEESALFTGDGDTTLGEGDTTTEADEDEEREGGWGDDEDGTFQPWQFDSMGRRGRQQEQLPPNAIRSPLPGLPGAQGVVDERTPLLAGPSSGTPARSAVSSAVPPSVIEGHLTARRHSNFSKEVWKQKIEEHRGESSWGQTLFNTINVLIGVGLLADPLALADSGWLFGMMLLLFCSFVTYYTAILLARLMALHPSSKTYADVLIRAYGPNFRSVIYFLFVVELSTFSVATVELFADSLASLYPAVGALAFKVIAFAVLLPTTFLPLRVLSLTSLLGIFSSFILLVVLISDGALKPEAPGSLREVMPTSLAPRWERFPLSFGLFMSGFSGHAVVPSLYRDMKNPRHFPSMAAVAFSVAFVVTLIFGSLGYLMFGNDVSAEITRDLGAIPSYPQWLTKIAIWLVAINPLGKYAIANKPLVQTFEHLIGLHAPPPPPVVESDDGRLDEGAVASSVATSSLSPHRQAPPTPAQLAETVQQARRTRIIRYTLLRPVLTLLCVGLAILIPEFDRVLAFLGSGSAFVICVILPVGAYLLSASEEAEETTKGEAGRNGIINEARRVRDAELARRGSGEEKLRVSRAEKVLLWTLLAVSVAMAAVGTVWSFLPVKEAGLVGK